MPSDLHDASHRSGAPPTEKRAGWFRLMLEYHANPRLLRDVKLFDVAEHPLALTTFEIELLPAPERTFHRNENGKL